MLSTQEVPNRTFLLCTLFGTGFVTFGYIHNTQTNKPLHRVKLESEDVDGNKQRSLSDIHLRSSESYF